MKIEWKGCLRLGVTIFLTYLAIHYWGSIAGFAGVVFGAAESLILGFGIAYVLNILMSFYEKHYFQKSQKEAVVKSRRIVCLLASILTLIAVVALVIGLVLPELASCVRLLAAEVPEAVEGAVQWLEESGLLTSILSEDSVAALTAIDWQEKIAQMIRVLAQGVGGVAQVAVNAVSATVSGVAKIAIGFVFAIYLLLGKETLTAQFNRVMDHYLKPAWNEKIRYVAAVFDHSFHNFIVGQCLEAVLLGLLCIVGMTILRFPYAMMIGTLIGFTALIPIAGAYIGAGVGAFMIMTVSPIQAVGFLVFIVVLQQLEGNLIYPKVVGGSIGLPGVWVLAAVTVGGGILGIPGMLLGVPATASVYRLLKQDINKPVKTDQ